MKKILAFALVLTFVFFASCGKNEVEQSDFYIESENSIESSNNSDLNENSKVVSEINAGYLEFESESYGFPQKYSDDYKAGKEIVLFKDYKNFSDFCDNTDFQIKEKYSQEFFDENLVIFIFFIRESGSIGLEAKNVYLDANGNITVKISENIPDAQTDDMQYKTIGIKLKKENCKGILSCDFILESNYSCYYSPDEIIEPNNIVTQHKFNGAIFDKSFSYDGEYAVSYFEIADSKYELDQIITNFENQKEDNLFLEYVNALDDDFFKENYLVALSNKTNYKDLIYELKRVDISEKSVIFSVYIDENNVNEYEDNTEIIVAEIPKNVFSENSYFVVKKEYVEQDFTKRLGNIEFTPYIFKGCSGGTHKNIALNSLNYLPLKCFLKKSHFDGFVDMLCRCYPVDHGFYDLAETFDTEFFEKYAVLVSYVYVDEGEKVTIENVKRHNHLGFGVLMMEIEIEDSVKPSSNENMCAYTLVAVIDKNETISYDWTNCAFEIK